MLLAVHNILHKLISQFFVIQKYDYKNVFKWLFGAKIPPVKSPQRTSAALINSAGGLARRNGTPVRIIYNVKTIFKKISAEVHLLYKKND